MVGISSKWLLALFAVLLLSNMGNCASLFGSSTPEKEQPTMQAEWSGTEPQTVTPQTETSRQSNQRIITLTDFNFVAIRGPIDDTTSSMFIKDILRLETNDIYIYLSTPGGSITSGHQIIQTMDALTAQGKNIRCIADIAASMGFIIFEACPVRYVLQNTILMQHQASMGVRGPMEQIRSRMKLVDSMLDHFDTKQAARLGLSTEEFRDIVMNDWWTYGSNALNHSLADEVVHVTCVPEVINKTVVEKRTVFIFDIEIEWVVCPLVKDPIRVDVIMKEEKVEEVKDQFYSRNYLKMNGDM